MTDSRNDEAAERDVLALGQEMFDAIRNQDAAALNQILAEDFVQRTATGSEAGKQEFVRGIREMPIEVTSVEGEHLHVSVYGPVAVMTGVQHAAWRQADGTEGVSSVAFVDVFERRGSRWHMVEAFGVDLPGQGG